MGDTPRLMKWDLVEDRYNKIGESDSDTYIKPMVTSAFSADHVRRHQRSEEHQGAVGPDLR